MPHEHAESTAGPVHFEVASTERPATDAGLRSRPILESQQLSAWYGHRKAIDSITLPMARHRITAIIGPSGSGKSTFLRCLNRLHETIEGARVEGHVLRGGQDIYTPGLDPVHVRRRIGMVFQRPNPFPTMSIFDNVVAGLELEHFLAQRDAELEPLVER